MLVVYAAATFVAVRHEFFEQLDDQLHDDFETGGRVSHAHRMVASRGPAMAVTIPTTTRIGQ